MTLLYIISYQHTIDYSLTLPPYYHSNYSTSDLIIPTYLYSSSTLISLSLLIIHCTRPTYTISLTYYLYLSYFLHTT